MKKIFTNKGVALLMVLWILMLLMVIVSEFAFSMRIDVNITRNYKETIQAYYIAVAGLHRGIFEIVDRTNNPIPFQTIDYDESDTDLPDWRINSEIPPVAFGNGHYKIRIDNENGKININRAGRSLLTLMLAGFDLDDDEKDIILDSIMDWRDKDHNHRLNGAEDDYYLSLPESYECKDDDFDSIDELLLVRGITTEIYYHHIENYITVIPWKDNGRSLKKVLKNKADYNRLNINAMSRKLWAMFPDMEEEMVDEIINYREAADFESFAALKTIVGPKVFRKISKYITMNLPHFIR